MIRRKHSTSELDLLTEKEKALRDEMDRLEAYLQGGAEKKFVILSDTKQKGYCYSSF